MKIPEGLITYIKSEDQQTVSISSFIDQAKYKLIGYHAFYKDGSKKFYETLEEIENNVSNPLTDIKQAGKNY